MNKLKKTGSWQLLVQNTACVFKQALRLEATAIHGICRGKQFQKFLLSTNPVVFSDREMQELLLLMLVKLYAHRVANGEQPD